LTQSPEQQSAFIAQVPALAVQQAPLIHVWPVEQPGAQLPPQKSSPHVLPVQLGVQHELLTQVWPELQSLAAIQATQVDVAVSQTNPEQQSLVLAQPESPLGIQLTQVMVVASQFCEQQSLSLAQGPAFAIQQLPLLQVWADEHVETQAPVVELHVRHWLASHGPARQVEPQTLALSQHPPLRHISPESQQMPLQHRPEQQVLTPQLPPAGTQGAVAHFPCGLQYPLQQSLGLSQPRPLRRHFGPLLAKTVLMLVRPSKPPTDAVTITLSAWRRELELARALVTSSKFDDCILMCSFQAKPDADPCAKAGSEAAPAFV
jgi:hypothetical protein